jgi:hypothetical protein
MDSNYITILDIIYHLITTSGCFVSTFTSHNSNKIGLNYAIIFNLMAFLSAMSLLRVESFFQYDLIFSIICISNGHSQNMGINLIVQKFDAHSRAVFYIFTECFSHIGKLIFAWILYNNSEALASGRLSITVFPILALVALQAGANLFLLNAMKEKASVKKKLNDESHKVLKTKHGRENSFKEIVGKPLSQMFSSGHRKQSYYLMLLNLTLGLQYYSVTTVFPRLMVHTDADLSEEIFTSKIMHTILAIFLPLLFAFPAVTRKKLLITTLTINFILNLFIVFGFSNSALILHIFRFIWNISFLTLNLYCSEVPKTIMNFSSSFFYLFYRFGCIVGIFSIVKLISFSIYLPIVINFIIIMMDIVMTRDLSHETHMKPLKEIEAEMYKDFI